MALAQDTLITESDTIITNTGVIEVDQVEVIKAFEAKLEDAKKISIQPKIKPIIPVEKTYDYNITIVPLSIEYPDPVIKKVLCSLWLWRSQLTLCRSLLSWAAWR